MRWFRFYTEALDDPKVQRLDPVTFKHWVNLLCVAAKNEGKLPPAEDMAFALRIDVIAAESLLDRLLIAGLIDVQKGGANGTHIAPHGWAKRQYKSDTSSERVKRYRERSKTVSETPSETETETEKPPVSPPVGDALSHADVVEGWNALAAKKGLPMVRKLTSARKRRLDVRLREYPDLDDWKRAFRHIHDTPWLCGDNPRGWRADFDFLLQSKSFTKLTEEAYGQAN